MISGVLSTDATYGFCKDCYTDKNYMLTSKTLKCKPCSEVTGCKTCKAADDSLLCAECIVIKIYSINF